MTDKSTYISFFAKLKSVYYWQN